MKKSNPMKLIGFQSENRFEQLRVILKDYRSGNSTHRLAQLINDNVYTGKLKEYKLIKNVIDMNTLSSDDLLLNLIVKEILMNQTILK